MKICFLTVIMTALLISSANYAQETATDTRLKIVRVPVLLATHYLFNYSLGLCHQFGPLITAKIFRLCGAELANKDETPNLHLSLEPTKTDIRVPEFKNNLLNAIMYASAPLAGLAACYFALKSQNVFHAYEKTGVWREALFKGLRSSAFRGDNSPFVGWVGLHAALNIFDCFPRFYKLPDGSIGGNSGAKVKYEMEQYLEKMVLQTGKI